MIKKFISCDFFNNSLQNHPFKRATIKGLQVIFLLNFINFFINHVNNYNFFVFYCKM